MIEALLETVAELCAWQREAAWGSGLQVETKSGPLDFVSEVDTESQRRLIAAIRRFFPDAGVIAEEDHAREKHSPPRDVFVIDPVDGTGNYLCRLPFWGISIGLLRDGVVHEGIVAMPASNHIYISTDFPKPPSPVTELSDVSYTGLNSEYDLSRLQDLGGKRRMLGATAPTTLLCALPSVHGRATLDLALFGPVRLWDIAGGAAFIKACGGAIIDEQNRDLTRVDLLDAYGGFDGAAHTRICCAVSASPNLARQAIGKGLVRA